MRYSITQDEYKNFMHSFCALTEVVEVKLQKHLIECDYLELEFSNLYVARVSRVETSTAFIEQEATIIHSDHYTLDDIADVRALIADVLSADLVNINA